ncbi:hypothetical protein Pmani_014744 [Petrolisthes manimaculis]|uniref:Uncharacterized protein n=1 Tax=Petrolisthes manimaculis TaxID=1843537 RepID=A0AAE1PTP3_9EUCA|nr:hypothetical protein Pmani_014744 [Petrolisthes manimaculis]
MPLHLSSTSHNLICQPSRPIHNLSRPMTSPPSLPVHPYSALETAASPHFPLPLKDKETFVIDGGMRGLWWWGVSVVKKARLERPNRRESTTREKWIYERIEVKRGQRRNKEKRAGMRELAKERIEKRE